MDGGNFGGNFFYLIPSIVRYANLHQCFLAESVLFPLLSMILFTFVCSKKLILNLSHFCWQHPHVLCWTKCCMQAGMPDPPARRQVTVLPMVLVALCVPCHGMIHQILRFVTTSKVWIVHLFLYTCWCRVVFGRWQDGGSIFWFNNSDSGSKQGIWRRSTKRGSKMRLEYGKPSGGYPAACSNRK